MKKHPGGPRAPVHAARAAALATLTLAIAVAATAASAADGTWPSTPMRAADPPPVRSYPSSAARIQRWIDTQNEAAIRAHAWDLWQSITTPSKYPGVPIWQTWYSGHELFETGPAARQQRVPGLHFERATQVVHHGHHRAAPTAAAAPATAAAGTPIPSAPAEVPTSFNRYSPSVAHFIWERRLNDSTVLDAINAGFDRNGTPVAARQLQTSAGATDPRSVVLKPVFQFVSGSAPTAIPVWTGVTPETSTNLVNPSVDTWRRCVVLDPTRRHPRGTTMSLPCNSEPARPWPVVSLDDFYFVRLDQALADAYSAFAKASGDDVGANNRTDAASVAAMVKPGNLALLMAMHVTGKEISNWTWQTFWWALDPLDPVNGRDRPKSIPRPWSRYNMTTAYDMTATGRHESTPLIAFNPYLETNLQGTVPGPGNTTIAWTGVNSNCMSCHRVAAWKAQTDNPGPANGWGTGPAYRPSGLISPGDASIFAGYTKLDFLWSLQRAQPPAPARAR